jgi:hypothetical protein
MPLFQEELSLFSSTEQKFGKGWALFVHFIAEARLDTNYTTTSEYQPILPQRVLLDTDHAPFIPDMSIETNEAILALDILADLSPGEASELLELWTTAMSKSESCRQLGRSMLLNGLRDPLILIPGIKDLIEQCS